jgi:hypothetical protein
VAAGSYAEWVFSLALIYLKVRFVYKYTVRGTKFVIDFYVEAAGGWIPVDVRNYRSDVDSSAQRYRRKFIGRLLDRMLVTIWDYQLATFEEAVTVVRRLIA